MMHDTERTDFPTCPFCGGVETALCDLDLHADEASTEFECGVCGTEMRCTIHISYTYSTRLLEDR